MPDVLKQRSFGGNVSPSSRLLLGKHSDYLLLCVCSSDCTAGLDLDSVADIVVCLSKLHVVIIIAGNQLIL